jgi:type I restriction enzyme S subunit
VELKPGYKQTEVGVIPEEWSVEQIGDLATVSSGGTPSREIPAYWNGSIPWITTSQIDFNTIAEADQFITENGLKNSAAKLLPTGTFLIALYGQGKTRGKVGVLGFEAATNQACASISLHDNVSSEFLLHFLTSRYEAIRNSSNTGSQENLNSQIVKAISIALPSQEEQRTIANALSDADALIESLEKLIAKKRSIKQGAMQELLTGKKRLPGFSGEWVVKQLGEVGELKNGINKNKEAFGHGNPFVNLMDIFGFSAISNNELLGLVNSTDLEQKTYDLRSGDVIFIRSSVKPTGVGLTAVILNNLPKTVYSGFLIRFRDEGLLDLSFKKYCFYEEGFRKKVIGASSVSANTNINQNSLKLLNIAFPATKAEQTAIAEVLSDMDTEITALETKLTKARMIKQGMMQELLTGRIRLI